MKRGLFEACFLVLAGALVWAGAVLPLWHEQVYYPYSVDELVNTSSAINLFEKGDYRNTSPFGGGREHFSPYVSSGIAATWPSALGWELGKDLETARLASVCVAIVFAALLGTCFFSSLGAGFPLAFAATSLVWLLLSQVAPAPGFMLNHGELEGALWLVQGALLCQRRPGAGALCSGVSVWLCKLMYLPAACAIAYGLYSRGSRKRPLVFFFLPLLFWLTLIFVRYGGESLLWWIKEFPTFVLGAHHGLDTAVPKFGLGDRLLLASEPTARGIFWAWLAIPTAIALLLPRVGRNLPPKAPKLFRGVLAAIWFYYLWFLFVSPVMFIRHMQPAIYVSIVASAAMVASIVASEPAARRWLRTGAGALLLLVGSLSAWKSWDAARTALGPERPRLAKSDLARAGISVPEIGIFRSLMLCLEGVAELGSGDHTIFAPVDRALFKVPETVIKRYATDKRFYQESRWAELLRHHLATGSFGPEALSSDQVIRMQDGNSVRITREQGKIRVDGARVLDVIPTRNGFIYLIDTLLVPSGLSSKIARSLSSSF